jgi:hypothetical protein
MFHSVIIVLMLLLCTVYVVLCINDRLLQRRSMWLHREEGNRPNTTLYHLWSTLAFQTPLNITVFHHLFDQWSVKRDACNEIQQSALTSKPEDYNSLSEFLILRTISLKGDDHLRHNHRSNSACDFIHFCCFSKRELWNITPDTTLWRGVNEFSTKERLNQPKSINQIIQVQVHSPLSISIHCF